MCSPSVSASNKDNGARGSDEELVRSAPEIYHNQFWLNHTQIEKAHRIAVDTVVSTAALRPHQEGFEEYISTTFGISEKNKKTVWQSSLSRQGVTHSLMLSCRVIKALRMAPKNTAGQSNLYLLLGIVPTKSIGDRVTKRGLLREEQEEGTIGVIFRSRTQLSTLEPSWNEQFDIPLQDREESTLVIEMWNSKEPITCMPQVNDAKGFARYLGRHVKLNSSDVLIGWTYCNAKTVYLQGDEMSLGLNETTPGRKCGSIKIHLSVSGKSEQSSKELINEHHMTLYKALVMKESEQALMLSQEGFPSLLSNDGERLLHLHACYSGLSKLQEYSMRLAVLLNYNKTCPFAPSVFIPLVDLLIAEYNLFCKEKIVASDETTNNEWQSGWDKEILSQFQTLLDELRKTLCDHLCVIDLANDSGVKVLEDHILLLKKLYTLDDFANRLPNNEKSIQNATIVFIKESFKRWFYYSVEDQGDDILLRDTVLQCVTLCGVVESKIGPAVQKHIRVDYFSTFISAMDGLLCSRNIAQDEQLACALMDIYFLLKNINDVYILNITDPRFCDQLQVTKYQSWFKEIVPVWLKNNCSNCNSAIAKAVKLDEYNRCTNATQFNVTKQLCIIISNIHHIQEELKPAPLSNSSEKKLFTLENDPCIDQSTSDLLQQTKGTIQSLFQEASDSCRQKILTLCEQMGHQFEATILTFIKDLRKPNTEENKKAISACLHFCNHRVLQKTWTSVVHAFNSSDFRSGSSEENLKIKDLLLTLHDVIVGERNENQLEIEEYKVVLNELQCMSRPTHHLVQDLCADLARQQVEASSSCGLGMVRTSVGYIKDQSTLEVTMVGNSIPCNGSLYISLDILPRVNARISPKRFHLAEKKLEGNSQNFSDELKV
eukprot:Em0014g216a